MFMKTRRLIIDRQLKKKNSANKKLLMINKKKQKTEHSSSLGNQLGHNKKLIKQHADGVDKNSKTLISGSCKKDTPSNKKSKRKLSSILKKSIRSRKKRKMEKVDKLDEIIEPVDHISELPEPIIHHILSLLRCPKDVTRTTAWSKKWRSIWASFFTFDFDQKKFNTSVAGDQTEKFITYVDNSLAAKLDPMHSVQKFKISLSNPNIKLKLCMDNWINSALDKNVKELEIFTECKKKRHYILPINVVTAKTLTSLKLYGCKFDEKIAIDLYNLKELSIKESHANADLIHSFIKGCPSMEDLRLVHCTGIGSLNISTLVKLTTVHIHECHGLVSVKVDLPNLTSFLHWSKKSWICEVEMTGCENLKHLTLKDPNLTNKMFQDYVAKFPNLEKISLRECDELSRIFILSLTLTGLSVIRCKKLECFLFLAPNLTVLEYSGEKMPFSSMDIEYLHEANLHLQIRKNRSVIFPEMLSFLRKFEKYGDWNLIVSSNKNITIYEDMQKMPHLSSNDLQLEFIKSPMKLKNYVDNLLRMSRPKTLSLVSSSSSEFLKFCKEKIMSREENPKCCTYYSKKCWLHCIKDVKMSVFNRAESQNLQQITFLFNWQS